MFCYYITHKVDLSLRRARTQAVSKMERGFFQRGQKKLAKKRGKGGGSGKKKAKKA